jgi:dihydropteroate synthase
MNRLLQITHPMRPLIMGILNVTPDSFSDGGDFLDGFDAVDHALYMAGEGADIIDVGGESTRPGSLPVAPEQQMQRILPIIASLRQALPEPTLISVDTTSAAVAEAALNAGADFINDVSAGRGDPAMFDLVARRGVPMVLMHMQGTPASMQDEPRYQDVVKEVQEFLLARVAAARAAGIVPEHLILDPGIGFGKRREDNVLLLAHLNGLVATGHRVLLGCSRKRFMGSICQESRPRELLGATVATTALGVQQGAHIFRVHDVRANRQAADVAHAIRLAGD